MARVAIGLGTNIGDRWRNLALVVDFINLHPEIRVTARSSVYETPALLPENAPDAWDMPFYNQVILAETALLPEALLAELKSCETRLGRQDRGRWGPREMDCDLLLYGEERIAQADLQVPHAHLAVRAFVLEPLSEIAPEWVVPGQGTVAALHQALRAEALPKIFPQRPLFMGIVNITPDSFSDGGAYPTPRALLDHVDALVAAGADFIDVGAESTRPGATPLSAEQEWERLALVLYALPKARSWQLSIDTYHFETAERAIALGVDWINDVSGLADPRMLKVLAEAEVQVAAMHVLSLPADPAVTLPADADVVADVVAWAEALLARAETAGIARERLMLDPGIGFGKTKLQSFTLIHRFEELKERVPGVRWLVGHSRKSYLTLFDDIPASARDALTLAHSALLAHLGADVLRVHNVALHNAWWRQ